MQIGESVTIDAFTQGSTTCPLEPHSQEEGFTSKPPRVKSVAELRKAMENGWSTRQWKQDGEAFTKQEQQEAPKKLPPELNKGAITIAGVNYPVSLAAHHIIPGKASLPESSLSQYIWAKEGKILSDIGYDCDGSENGIWLPTHQAMSANLGKKQSIVIHDEATPTSTKGLSWAQLSEKAKQTEENEASYSALFLRRYTQQAMEATDTQFHDAHSNYNDFVIRALNKINTFLNTRTALCEKCQKNTQKKSPPYMLVYRLNTLSSQIASRYLRGTPSEKWLSVYTSEFSSMYARAPLSKDRLY